MMRLEAEIKQITHAIRMTAYNTETALARALDGHYARAGDEAYALIREALTASGDIIPATANCSSGSTRSPRPGEPRPSPPSATSSTRPQAATPAPISSCTTRSNPTLALHELTLYVRSPGSRARCRSARLRGMQPYPGMAVLVVVIGEERAAERAGVLERPE